MEEDRFVAIKATIGVALFWLCVLATLYWFLGPVFSLVDPSFSSGL